MLWRFWRLPFNVGYCFWVGKSGGRKGVIKFNHSAISKHFEEHLTRQEIVWGKVSSILRQLACIWDRNLKHIKDCLSTFEFTVPRCEWDVIKWTNRCAFKCYYRLKTTMKADFIDIKSCTYFCCYAQSQTLKTKIARSFILLPCQAVVS